jgi:hypothetical protein
MQGTTDSKLKDFSIRKKTIVFSVAIILLLQIPISKSHAAENPVVLSYYGISGYYAGLLAAEVCGPQCVVGAIFVMNVANVYAPTVAHAAADYVRPGIIQMFTNWGTSFFRP